jgi:hypothetical protein
MVNFCKSSSDLARQWSQVSGSQYLGLYPAYTLGGRPQPRRPPGLFRALGTEAPAVVGSAAAVAAVRRCYGVTAHVRCTGARDPDVTLAE